MDKMSNGRIHLTEVDGHNLYKDTSVGIALNKAIETLKASVGSDVVNEVFVQGVRTAFEKVRTRPCSARARVPTIVGLGRYVIVQRILKRSHA